MSASMAGVIVGGLLPALFFGISGAFAKPSMQAGIGIGLYLICVGLAAAAAGSCFYLFSPDKTLSFRSGGYALLVGVCWAIAAGLVALALTKYGVPVAKLVPLYNMNTLVTVFIGLVVFAEWKDVSMLKLALGSLLVVAGGTLVATS